MVKWKRENVPDHKFDFVDVQEFVKGDFLSRVKYSAVFFMVLKAVLVYLGDLYNAGRLIFVDNGGVITKTKVIPPNIAKWIFVGSVMLSFVLLFIEVRKAKKIIASGDISFAFTNVVAKRYYNLTSFAHWCFFEEITDQLSTLDNLAFFVFFSFKGWKRLLVCDGPRQTINAIFLFTVFSEKGFSLNLSKYGSLLTAASLGVTAFTVIVFAISAFLLAISFLIYLPLLCKIRGNLKEYCCHLIDKRIEKLLKRQRERRIQRAKKGSVNYNGKKPTLPVLDYDDNQPQPPPMMYNNNNYGIPPPGDPYLMGRPNVPRTQTPHSQGMYDYQNKGSMEGGYNAPYKGRRGSDSSQGIVPVSPLYAKNAVAETIDYPQRPDSNNSNSAYSDTSTKYSGQGKIPYQYPPQHQYPYQQMPPPSGFNNVDQHTDQYADQYVDPYNLVDDYQQNSASNPYNYQNDPYSNSNSNQYYGEAYYDNNDYNYNNYNNYYQPPSPQNAQFSPIESQQPTIIPPSQKNKSPAMYQQNRPYNNKGGRY